MDIAFFRVAMPFLAERLMVPTGNQIVGVQLGPNGTIDFLFRGAAVAAAPGKQFDLIYHADDTGAIVRTELQPK